MGSTFIAIDPSLLVDVDKFKSDCSNLVVKVKASRSKDKLRLPGERASKAFKQAEVSGEVDVDEVILKQLDFTPAGSK